TRTPRLQRCKVANSATTTFSVIGNLRRSGTDRRRDAGSSGRLARRSIERLLSSLRAGELSRTQGLEDVSADRPLGIPEDPGAEEFARLVRGIELEMRARLFFAPKGKKVAGIVEDHRLALEGADELKAQTLVEPADGELPRGEGVVS